MHIKKILAAVIITLSLASCGSSADAQAKQEANKTRYIAMSAVNGVEDEAVAVRLINSLCAAAEKPQSYLGAYIYGFLNEAEKDGIEERAAEFLAIQINYGVPGYCPEKVSAFDFLGKQNG